MPNAAGMAQLNVRIDPEVKAVAEANMERIGYTPTEVVRMVYELAAKGVQGFSLLVHTSVDAFKMMFAEEEVVDAEDEFLKKHDAIFLRFCEEVGLDPENLPPFPPRMSDEELLAEYHDERDRERGLGIYAARED